jgi:hypothetical protein
VGKKLLDSIKLAQNELICNVTTATVHPLSYLAHYIISTVRKCNDEVDVGSSRADCYGVLFLQIPVLFLLLFYKKTNIKRCIA